MEGSPVSTRVLRTAAVIAVMMLKTGLGEAQCGDLITRVAPTLRHEQSANVQARIDVVRCSDTRSLHIMGFGNGKNTAPLWSVDTHDQFIAQILTKGTVAAIQTGGGTTSRIWVVKFDNGVPRMIWRAVTKDDPVLASTGRGISVTVTLMNGSEVTKKFEGLL